MTNFSDQNAPSESPAEVWPGDVIRQLPGTTGAPDLDDAIREQPGPSTANEVLGRFARWGIRGGSSILQQGMFSGAHFLTNILLARWLSPGSYGAFALIYSFFLLILTGSMALFFEPLLVFGPGRYANRLSSYVAVLVKLHFLFFVPVGLVIAALAPLINRLYGHESFLAFLGLIVLAPSLVLVWLCRAAFYAELKPHLGTVAGIFYFVGLLLAVCILQKTGWLSPATAVVAMAIAGVFIAAGCLFQVLGRKRSEVHDPNLRAEVIADHWSYGRWSALTAMMVWVPANLYYALLPSRFGLASAAELRALTNLIYPLLHTATALNLLLIPVLVRQVKGLGSAFMARTVRQMILWMIPLAGMYFAVIAMFSQPLLTFLYAGKYSHISKWAVVCIGFIPVTNGIAGLLGAGLRSLEKPHLIFWGYGLASLTAIAVGCPLTLHYGVSGAASSLLLTDIPAILLLAIFLKRAVAT
jgi:O-antigen/teichoic acid export membrane protein